VGAQGHGVRNGALELKVAADWTRVEVRL